MIKIVDINDIREALKQDLKEHCTPARYGSEYLAKEEELIKLVDELELNNVMFIVDELDGENEELSKTIFDSMKEEAKL